MRSILVNPIYTGDMVWNRRTDARFHKIQEGRAVECDVIHGVRQRIDGRPAELLVVARGFLPRWP